MMLHFDKSVNEIIHKAIRLSFIPGEPLTEGGVTPPITLRLPLPDPGTLCALSYLPFRKRGLRKLYTISAVPSATLYRAVAAEFFENHIESFRDDGMQIHHPKELMPVTLDDQKTSRVDTAGTAHGQ